MCIRFYFVHGERKGRSQEEKTCMTLTDLYFIVNFTVVNEYIFIDAKCSELTEVIIPGSLLGQNEMV